MFSIIMPMDVDRFSLFTTTKLAYNAMPQTKEIIIPTRYPTIVRKYLEDHKLGKDVKIVGYTHEEGFNPAKALNLGVRVAKYDSLIITCPEVKPVGNVLEQLEARVGQNVVCQVWLLDEDGNRELSLVNKDFRSETPGFYFLAMYNKKDVEAINGWDERFMAGHAYEDEDFGERWVRAGLPFEIAEDIEAEHQWHAPHGELCVGAGDVNWRLLKENTAKGVTRCRQGLVQS